LRRVVKEKLGKKAAFPGFIKPALAEQLSRPPKGEGWIHEVKFDGYRVQLHIANDAVKVLTRRGYDWTTRFKKIATDAWRINARSAIIDGEVVAPAADGVSDFSVLQKEIRAKRSDRLVMYAFDLLYLNGNDFRAVPLDDRKARLRDLIRNTDILFSESFEADGATIFAPVKWESKALSQSVRRVAIDPTGRTIGLSRLAGSVKRWSSLDMRSRKVASMDFISGVEAVKP
jgi:bifunctional non-homologous end joining protein LigD